MSAPYFPTGATAIAERTPGRKTAFCGDFA